MKLKHIFDNLLTSEFSQHSLGKYLAGTDFILPKYANKVVTMINAGIGDIYSHSNIELERKEVIIRLKNHISDYELTNEHRFSDYNTWEIPFDIQHPQAQHPDIYIHDIPNNRFYEDELINIIHVYDEEGKDLLLNDSNEIWSIHIPRYNVVRVLYPDKQNALSIIYRAKPRKFKKFKKNIDHVNGTISQDKLPDYIEFFNQERQMPAQIMLALTYFVATRVHIGMSKQESMVEANFWKNKYDEQLVNIINNDINQIEHFTDDITERGWV